MMADTGIDRKSARAAIGLPHAEEKRIALALSPAVAWPTLALAVILPLSLAALVYLGLTGAIPYWLATPAIGLVMYAHYTLVHEAVHGNVVSRPARLAWVNAVVGWIGSLGLSSGWPLLQRVHLLHHSHTNTERDPDIFVKGSFLSLIGKWLLSTPMLLVPLWLRRFISPKTYRSISEMLSPREIFLTSIVGVAQIAILALAIATGHFKAWLWLWFMPYAIAIFILITFFQWLPHHPFDSAERYKNTRISLWPGGAFLLLQQNLHLMHHLWPSVPFYNYNRLFGALRPVLGIEGSRIEGLLVGRYRKRMTDHAPPHSSPASGIPIASSADGAGREKQTAYRSTVPALIARAV